MSACVMRPATIHSPTCICASRSISAKRAMHLTATAIDPRLVILGLRAKEDVLEQQQALVRRTEGERDDVQRAPALIARRRQQGPLGAGRVVEEIENGTRVDQHLAVGLHQRGDPAQRIELPDQLEVLAKPTSCGARKAASRRRRLTATRRTNGESNIPIRIMCSVSTFHLNPSAARRCASSTSMRAACVLLIDCKCSDGPVSTSSPRFRTLPAARIPALCWSKRSLGE